MRITSRHRGAEKAMKLEITCSVVCVGSSKKTGQKGQRKRGIRERPSGLDARKAMSELG
jgi:hypothetical protein